MASITIPNLPAAIALNGTEQFEAVQAGTSVRVTTAQMFAFATGITIPFTVADGGTGVVTFTSNGLIYGNGTGALQQVAVGTTGQVLIGNTGAAPSWGAATGVAVTSISFGSTGLTPNSTTQGDVTVAGTLVVANGGTGATTATNARTNLGLGTMAVQNATAIAVTGGTVDGTAVGGVTPSTGVFTTVGTTSAIAGSAANGPFYYGTLPYSDTNIWQSFQANVNSFAQVIISNASTGTLGSSDFIVGNGQTTATTFFGDFGMNSSGFSGTGALNAVNNVFLTSTSADLAIGTTTSNAIHFVVNNGATDAMTISSAGAVTLGTALAVGSGGTGAGTFTANGVLYGNTTSAIQVTAQGGANTILVANAGAPSFSATPTIGTSVTVPLVVGGTAAGSALTLQSTSGVGTTDTIVFKTGNNGAVTALTIASNGNATFLSSSTTAMGTVTVSTSVTSPLVIGGSGVGSALTLQSTSGAGATDTIVFKVGNAGGTTVATMASTTAFLLMGAGTTAIAPFKLTSGTNLTTAAAGAVEYDGSAMYFSPAASTRSTVMSRQIMYLGTAYTLTNATGVQKMFNGSTNGQVTLPVGDYEFECYSTISALPATGTFGFAMAGTATYTQAWQAIGARVAAGTAATPSVSFNTTANTAVTPTSATTTAFMSIKGTINVTVTGTVIPQFSMTTTAAAAIIGVGSFFWITPFSGTNGATNVAIGNWS